MTKIDPKQFIITRKRKKYKFALFHNSPLCFEAEQWQKSSSTNVLEMGAGTGLFGLALAKASPKLQVVAYDIKADRLQAGAKLAEAEAVSNIRFLRARADQLADYFEPASLQAIWITFPDPFPKDRSAKRRLVHPDFLAKYATLLRSDGALYLKTDAVALFDWGLDQLVENKWKIADISFNLHASNLPEEYKVETTYERRYKANGKRICLVKALPPSLDA